MIINGLISIKAQEIFDPSEQKPRIIAVAIEDDLEIDGVLSEEHWKMAKPVKSFKQLDPMQGEPAKQNTEVSILYNRKNLYIGVFCKDTLGKKGIRVPDLRRDFGSAGSDLFGISLDPFNDARNAQSFQTNPYGVQRDLLVIDGNTRNTNWDGLWVVRTSRTDSGWVAEMEIPWKSIRYPKSGQTWNVNFFRNARRINEFSAWSPVPRVFSPYRMNYAGEAVGITPPPPSMNLRVQPYGLVQTASNSEQEYDFAAQTEYKIGGEVKWAITPNTILDVTANTDFAQADADRKVINLSRFSVFFPERRQFFLENGNIFSVGWSGKIEPFFSRRIGLDNSGGPIPLIGGLRLTHRDAKRNVGALVMHQQRSAITPETSFGVARYSHNFGKQNRIGGLFTGKWGQPTDSTSLTYNYSGTIDGFMRINQSLEWRYMVSTTTNEEGSDGIAAYSNLEFSNNWLHMYLDLARVDDQYNPEVGFVGRTNYITTNPGFYFIIRNKPWIPKFVRAYEPGIFLDMYSDASDYKLLEYSWQIYPLWVKFQDGTRIAFSIEPTYQYLPEAFYPLSVEIKDGHYDYVRYLAKYTSDLSKKVSGMANYFWGTYYDGKLQTLQLQLTVSPIPHVYFSTNYQLSRVEGLGVEGVSKDRHLIAPELRLAINPRLQLNGFYQWSFDEGELVTYDRSNWNVRFSWEFKPLSYIYIVFNERVNALEEPRWQEQQLITKVTYLHQF